MPVTDPKKLLKLHDILANRLPANEDPTWASDLLAQFGFTNNPSHQAPPSLRSPISHPSTHLPNAQDYHVSGKKNTQPTKNKQPNCNPPEKLGGINKLKCSESPQNKHNMPLGHASGFLA